MVFCANKQLIKGKTRKETLKHIQDAIKDYLEGLSKHSEPISTKGLPVWRTKINLFRFLFEE